MKKNSKDITIREYSDEYKAGVIKAIIDIQEVERMVSDTRRPGVEMAEEYFEEIKSEVKNNSGMFFLATLGLDTVGFIGGWIQKDQDPIQTAESNKYGYISDAWVKKELRGEGIFKKLEKEILKHFLQFDDIKRVRLNVLSDNIEAIRAYEGLGYNKELITMMRKIKQP